MNTYVLALDQGTTSTRSMVFDHRGRIVAAAQRAKQIKDGSPPLVETSARNPLTIALSEIAQGKVIVQRVQEAEEDVNTGTLDQYFAGRDAAVDEGLAFRRSVRPEAASSLGDDDFDDDDDYLEDDDDDDLDDDDE